MRSGLGTWLLIGAAALAHANPAASVAQSVLRQSEALVEKSVVRIERRTAYRNGAAMARMINHGTGVIVGRERLGGRTEYLLLSNEHVAHNEHVRGTSELFIVAGEGVRAPIRLETVAIDYRRDQALLRTIDCPETFTVPDYAIGPPPGDIRRDAAFTEGYGGGEFSILAGDILSTNAEEWGIRCYRFDVPVAGGQSGAPLVVLGPDQKLYLPGLVFCGDDRHSEATPLEPDKGVLKELRAATHTNQ